MPGRFGPVVTAMVTPFQNDGSLDVTRAQELARRLLDTGSSSLVVAGSTGEAATMSDQEKDTLFRAVVEAVEGRGKVIAGTGTYDTAHSIHLSEWAEKAGVDALLVVTPYYNKPPQRGLIEHFTAVAGATSLPNIVYNIPGRTATRISHETLLRLAEVENIVAVKDSTADLDGLAHLLREIPDGFDVYQGDDWATFISVCLGAAGVISVAAHLVGDRMAEMIESIESGDVASARKIHLDLVPLFDALFVTSNPIPVKAALGLAGFPVGSPRRPLVPANEDEIATLRGAMEGLGLL
ncbi:MAG TPA: 4-hydroxy-tetrahydrodipicolinate synthase [Actinomycetota bacterium]|nr:4-hydroxy-tetrahydrodipicolinate synthase [Actinomycetota bacterium]